MGSISRTTRSRHACRSATLRALRLSAGGAAAPAVVAGPVAAGVDDGNGPYLRPATKTVHRTQIHASAESHQGELPAAPPPPPPPPLLRCALAGTPGPRSSCRRSASQALDPATALMLRRAVRAVDAGSLSRGERGRVNSERKHCKHLTQGAAQTARCRSHAIDSYMCAACDTVSEYTNVSETLHALRSLTPATLQPVERGGTRHGFCRQDLGRSRAQPRVDTGEGNLYDTALGGV